MRIILSVMFFMALSSAQANTCVSALTDVKNKVERNLSGLSGKVASHCKLWLNDRSQYQAQKASLGAEPCPSDSQAWQVVKSTLLDAYGSARSICKSNTCDQGCGTFLSILRNGGDFDKALKSVPQ